ncbi:MAG: 16S rRNA (uracil(1498)-N(3))-methyltransferase [Propionibacteriaceae bacterium]|nr:16S rRNA (uracil(1498)-N(3))-methyltransferase [Propionibacteriaceae bacterium]
MSDGFFIAELPSALAVGDDVALTGDEAFHAAKVRRIRLGEEVTITDGAGRGVVGPTVAVAPAEVRVRAERIVEAPAPFPTITVVQALPKNDRALVAVDLLTEVGADRIVPWQAARSIPRWDAAKAERGQAKWATTAREAAKQARRWWIPEVAPLASTAQVAALLAGSVCPIVCHEAATIPLWGALGAARSIPPAEGTPDVPPTPGAASRPFGDAAIPEIVCVIGPEGGVSDEEREQFTSAGALLASLGPTVLRTSTAGSSAVTQLRLVLEIAAAFSD